jgi:hypothetical protein
MFFNDIRLCCNDKPFGPVLIFLSPSLAEKDKSSVFTPELRKMFNRIYAAFGFRVK